GQVDALLGSHLKLLLASLVDVQHGVLGVVVEVGILGKADALQRVRADGQSVVQSHLLLTAAIEGSPGQSNDDDHHAKVDDITAIAAGVAAGEQIDGRKQNSPGFFFNNSRGAPKNPNDW